MTDMDAGKIIRRHRTARLLSVRRLARDARLSAGYVSQIESGKRPLTTRVTGAFADALGIAPHELLAECGFIPEALLADAKEAAAKAMALPDFATRARGRTDAERRDWLIADYLIARGHDPYGTLSDRAMPPPALNWSPLLPDAPTPAADALREAIEHARAQAAAATPIEGWEELSDSDRQFVQQMVNKLRRRPTGE